MLSCKKDPVNTCSVHLLATSLDQCADEMEDCTDAPYLDSMSLESDLNCEAQTLPSLSLDSETTSDSDIIVLQELGTPETSSSWEAIDFEPVRRMRSLQVPAPPPKRFYTSRWCRLVKRTQERQHQLAFSRVAFNTRMDVDK